MAGDDKWPDDWAGIDGRPQWIHGYISDLRRGLGEIAKTTLASKYDQAHALIRRAITNLEKMDGMVVGLRDGQ